MSKIFIIHDVDGKIYFEFLEKYYQVEYIYSRSLRFFVAELIKKKSFSLNKLKSFTKLISLLLFAKNQTIIIAIAPGSIKFLFFERLFKRNRIIYHTSWLKYEPYSPRFNYYFLNRIIRRKWYESIKKENVEIVTVTAEGKSQLSSIFCKTSIRIIEHPTKFTPLNINTFKKKKTNNLIFIGRLAPEKGINILVKIAEKLPKELKLKVAGDGPLKHMIKKQKNIQYLGFLNKEQVQAEFSRSDFLISPSLRTKSWEELFGMSIIEAMSQGVIPICTDHTGPKSIVTKNVNGYLFNEKDFLTKSLKAVKDLNEDQIYKMQVNCINTASRYSTHNILNKWKNLIG